MFDSSVHGAFLSLIRLGLGHSSDCNYESEDWFALRSLAARQGLLAILFDGVKQLPESIKPPQIERLRWIGEVMQGYELQYALYKKAVLDLSAWCHAHGYRMMLLKGLACGMNWPKPEHRPYGDIDIWLFGKQQAADKEMFEEFKKSEGFKIDNSHHHHTVFQWQGFTVENHYDFLNVHHHKSNVELEAILKEIADDGLRLTAYGLLPSANFNALFLLRHAMSHFASTGMSLRQLLDWAFFVEKHGEEVDWDWLQGVLKKYGMQKMFDVMNAICKEDLGFQWVVPHAALDVASHEIAGQARNEDLLKERVLNEILSREFDESTPKHVWKRVPFKYRRWKANAWKHELCYNESMSSSFWSGVKNHLLKPASI